MTLNGVMALVCVISANSASFRAHCVKIHVRYLISWWVLVRPVVSYRWVHISMARAFSERLVLHVDSIMTRWKLMHDCSWILSTSSSCRRHTTSQLSPPSVISPQSAQERQATESWEYHVVNQQQLPCWRRTCHARLAEMLPISTRLCFLPATPPS